MPAKVWCLLPSIYTALLRMTEHPLFQLMGCLRLSPLTYYHAVIFQHYLLPTLNRNQVQRIMSIVPRITSYSSAMLIPMLSAMLSAIKGKLFQPQLTLHLTTGSPHLNWHTDSLFSGGFRYQLPISHCQLYLSPDPQYKTAHHKQQLHHPSREITRNNTLSTAHHHLIAPGPFWGSAFPQHHEGHRLI
jgi:hypothetical protein